MKTNKTRFLNVVICFVASSLHQQKSYGIGCNGVQDCWQGFCLTISFVSLPIFFTRWKSRDSFLVVLIRVLILQVRTKYLIWGQPNARSFWNFSWNAEFFQTNDDKSVVEFQFQRVQVIFVEFMIKFWPFIYQTASLFDFNLLSPIQVVVSMPFPFSVCSLSFYE